MKGIILNRHKFIAIEWIIELFENIPPTGKFFISLIIFVGLIISSIVKGYFNHYCLFWLVASICLYLLAKENFKNDDKKKKIITIILGVSLISVIASGIITACLWNSVNSEAVLYAHIMIDTDKRDIVKIGKDVYLGKGDINEEEIVKYFKEKIDNNIDKYEYDMYTKLNYLLDGNEKAIGDFKCVSRYGKKFISFDYYNEK